MKTDFRFAGSEKKRRNRQCGGAESRDYATWADSFHGLIGSFIFMGPASVRDRLAVGAPCSLAQVFCVFLFLLFIYLFLSILVIHTICRIHSYYPSFIYTFFEIRSLNISPVQALIT